MSLTKCGHLDLKVATIAVPTVGGVAGGTVGSAATDGGHTELALAAA